MSFLDEGTFVGKGAVQDALKDPEFKALKGDEKAKALKTLKIGGSITTEKKGKDLDGDGDIDSKDYLAARNAAIKKAKSMKEGVAKDLYIKAMESSSLEEFLSDVYQDYPQHKGNSDIANYLKNYYLDAGGPIDEGKVKDFLKGAALLAALIGLNKAASENIYKSDPKIKALTSKYEKAEKEGDKKAMADFKKEIEKRKLQWDTGKIDEADLGSKIGDALFGKSYDKPFSNLMDTIKDLLNKDKTTSSSDDSKLILKIANIEKGNLSEKEFKSILKKLKNAGMSNKKLQDLEKRYKKSKEESKNPVKEDEQIELPADTTFTVDLKHLMKKHMDEGKSKEDTIKFTKALMAKLHNKGEVTVDGTKIVFKEGKKKSGYMGYTDMAEEADLDVKDTQLALPEPDAPDYLGDDGMDYEGGMAKSQMLKMKKYAMALCDMVDDESQLEAWVQAKITKASDYMSSVYHYLDYQQTKNLDEASNMMDTDEALVSILMGEANLSEETAEQVVDNLSNEDFKKAALMLVRGTDERLIAKFVLSATTLDEGFKLNGREVVDLETDGGGSIDPFIGAAYYLDTGEKLTDDEIEALVDKYPADLELGGAWWDQQR